MPSNSGQHKMSSVVFFARFIVSHFVQPFVGDVDFFFRSLVIYYGFLLFVCVFCICECKSRYLYVFLASFIWLFYLFVFAYSNLFVFILYYCCFRCLLVFY